MNGQNFYIKVCGMTTGETSTLKAWMWDFAGDKFILFPVAQRICRHSSRNSLIG